MTGERPVLVTGATGHLGTNLVLALAQRGIPVRALARSRLAPSAVEGLSTVRFVRGDVTDPSSLCEAMEGVATVYHLAAKISLVGDPDGSVWRTNVDGTKNVLAVAKQAQVPRVVHCSSVHAFNYADTRQSEINEDSPLVAPDADAPAYDRSKAEGQRFVLKAVAQGLDAVVVQPSGVIGPDDYAPSSMGRAFLKLRDRKVPAVITGGFDFVDARDVAHAMIRAAEVGRRGQNYLLTGRYCTIAELAEAVEQVTGTPAPRRSIPLGLARRLAPFTEWGARIAGGEPELTRESARTLALKVPFNAQLAQDELDFSPRSLIDSVRDIYADFERRGM